MEKVSNKKKLTEQKFDKLNNGRMTLKTMFRNESKREEVKQNVENDITKIERDRDISERIVNIIEKHIAKSVIAKFKRDKQHLYYKILNLVSVKEIHN